MSWQALILLQTVLAAGSILTFRVLARDKKTAKASFVINLGAYTTLYLVFLLAAPWLGHIKLNDLQIYWWRFVIGGLAFALTNVFTYKTLVYFDAAISTIVSTLNTLFTIIGAAWFLSEDLSLRQAIGALVLVAAIAYGILSTHTLSKKNHRQSIRMGLFFGLLAGLSYGVAVVNEKWLLMHMSTGSYALFGVGGQLVMALVVALIIQPGQMKLLLNPRVAGWSFGSGLLRGLAGLCFILAEVKSNNVALVTVISNFKIIIVALLGWWLLKERQYLVRKLYAAVSAISGLAIMLWHG